MAVQQIIGKQITKYDTEKLSKNPNFVQPEKQEVKKEIVNALCHGTGGVLSSAASVILSKEK